MKEKVVNLLEDAEKTIGILMLEINRLNVELEATHKLIKEQDMKIINLSFDVAYANRTIELLNKESE
jgi:hypothetical protein